MNVNLAIALWIIITVVGTAVVMHYKKKGKI